MYHAPRGEQRLDGTPGEVCPFFTGLPFGPLGEVARRRSVARDLERTFDYRAEALRRR